MSKSIYTDQIRDLVKEEMLNEEILEAVDKIDEEVEGLDSKISDLEDEVEDLENELKEQYEEPDMSIDTDRGKLLYSIAKKGSIDLEELMQSLQAAIKQHGVRKVITLLDSKTAIYFL